MKQQIVTRAELLAIEDRAMPEKGWQQEVIAYAHDHGWRVAHFRPARTARGWRTPMQGDPGFPDLVLARDGAVLLIELKKWGEHPSEEQLDWIMAAGDAGQWWSPKHRELMKKVLE